MPRRIPYWEKTFISAVSSAASAISAYRPAAVYIATSNRDWNPGKGFPKTHDDRIIRLSPTFQSAGNLRVLPQSANLNTAALAKGAVLYANYCEACHKPDGRGIKAPFPRWTGASW